MLIHKELSHLIEESMIFKSELDLKIPAIPLPNVSQFETWLIKERSLKEIWKRQADSEHDLMTISEPASNKILKLRL